MTWDVWSGDGRAEKVELATLELGEFAVLWLFIGLVAGLMVGGLMLVAAFILDPIFGPVPFRAARVHLPWHA